MIDVYTWPTPNGHKVHIMLEETGLEHRIHAVNIREGEQFKPEFLRVSPNHRIPAIVDNEGPGGKPLSLFESGGSCSISRRNPANSCRRTLPNTGPPSSGSCGRWAGWDR